MTGRVSDARSRGGGRYSPYVVCGLLLVAMLVMTKTCWAADFHLVVLDKEVEVRCPPVMLGHTLYLWVSDVVEPLGDWAVVREGQPARVDIVRGEETLLSLSEGEATARGADGVVRLDYAPYVSEGGFMVPAREVWEALGAYTWFAEDKNTLYVSSELRDIRVSLEDSRLVLRLDCSLPVDYKVYSLEGPARLVVDLPGTKLKATCSSFAVGSDAIARVRAAQTGREPFSTRVVADLIGAQEHQVLSPERAGMIAVRIGGSFERWPLPALPKVSSVSFSQTSDEEAEVRIGGDRSPEQFSTFILKSPLRLVVDIPEAILQAEGKAVRTKNRAVKEVRFSQYRVAPFIVRVVVVLDEPHPFFFEKKDGLVIRFSLGDGKGIVVLDPGHGGPDTGAIGSMGSQEKDLNLDVTLRLGRLLIEDDIKPILTRSCDTYVSLDERCNLANAIDADVFVSLHCNAWIVPTLVKGLETYYFHPRGEELARTLHRVILERLNRPDRGVRVARFVVVRKTAMPATLVEMGYISSEEEEGLLRSPEFRQSMADALKEGIEEYMMAHGLGPWSSKRRGEAGEG